MENTEINNMKLWDIVKQPPNWAMKKITGGRLKGMTDIKPQWRYQVLTENFGPCGDGWNYKITERWTNPGPDGQVGANVIVELQVCNNNPIEGVGGSMLVAKESSGLRYNDEAWKMATTDALSNACKMIGIGANIYAGRDETKYDTSNHEKKSKKGDMPNDQAQAIVYCANKHGMTKPELKVFIEWLADREKCGTRDQKIANLLLPDENFMKTMDEYTTHIAEEIHANDVA